MIVADTSALMAVVFGEPDYGRFADVLDREDVTVSTATLTEALIVADGRQGVGAVHELQLVVSSSVDRVAPYDREHALAAHAAWRRFGKGRHPAALNLGDCMAYATAKLAGAPLLFKGGEFAQTDIAAALDG